MRILISLISHISEGESVVILLMIVFPRHVRRAIMLFKTAESSIPRILLIDLVSEKRGTEQSPSAATPPATVKLMRRDQQSSTTSTPPSGGKAPKKIVLATRAPQHTSNPTGVQPQLLVEKKGPTPVKSVSEREKEYAEARARIFGTTVEDEENRQQEAAVETDGGSKGLSGGGNGKVR